MAAATDFELLKELSSKNEAVTGGDVTRFVVNYGWEYSKNYASVPGAGIGGIPGLPVEKPNFSTISTGFSTAGFHRNNLGDIHFRLT